MSQIGVLQVRNAKLYHCRIALHHVHYNFCRFIRPCATHEMEAGKNQAAYKADSNRRHNFRVNEVLRESSTQFKLYHYPEID